MSPLQDFTRTRPDQSYGAPYVSMADVHGRPHLGAGEWRRARLHEDAEALAWLAALKGDGENVLWCELIGEGAIAYRQPINPIWGPDVRCSSCTCVPRWRCFERDDDWVTVRRYWRGPVPRQVLAAFEFPARRSLA